MREIVKGICYIGVDDEDLDLFESQYIVPEGISYNSYLIKDDKLAVMDTVDARKTADWMSNLQQALEGRVPDYLVLHHVEPDHSGSVSAFLEKYPETTVVATAMALKFLGQFQPGLAPKSLAVKDGDTLALGTHTLKFLTAPMVHWPEVLFSYDQASGTLFSADAFGKFGALSQCGFFGDEDGDWACEARRYYFNICGKYGPQVASALKKMGAPKVIAPLHGPILRQGLEEYIGLYNTWSSYGVETPGVFIAYASIHGNTAEVALKLADILKAKGCPKVALNDLTRDDWAEGVEDAFRYGKMVLAAASYDAGLFTPAYNFLHTLQMKGWQNRQVALIENGSWAPSAGRVMKEMLGAMKNVEVVGNLVTIRGKMTQADVPALEELADAILKA